MACPLEARGSGPGEEELKILSGGPLTLEDLQQLTGFLLGSVVG